MIKITKFQFGASLAIILLFAAYQYLRPAIYYGGQNGWEDIKIMINNFLIDINPEKKFTYKMSVLLNGFIEPLHMRNNHSYKDIFSLNEDLYTFSNKNNYIPIYKGFKPIKIENSCFIFEAEAIIIENSIGTSITKYRKVNPESSIECKINCKIYFTEKGLLETGEVYTCL